MKTVFEFAQLLLAGLAAVPALASPAGDLDPAFGDYGRILLRDAPFEEFIGIEGHVDQASGKLLIAADGYYDGDRILRFNADGSLDPTFGDHGALRLRLAGDRLDLYDIVWMPDGKLLLAGALNVYGTPDNVLHGTALLARMRADGTPDLSFGDNGRAIFQHGGVLESISRILPQADGRIVVLGGAYRNGGFDTILARYTQDGAPDNNFGNGATLGFVVIDTAGVDARLKATVQQRDGKFLICGDATTPAAAPGPAAILAIRVRSGGTPDPTFGSNGMLLIDGWQDAVNVATCVELADGHVIFAGTAGSDERQRAAAWRMTPDGRLDSGFGTGGMAVLDTGTQSAATAMLIMADGSLAIAGSQWKPSDVYRPGNTSWIYWSDMLIARIDPVSGDVDRAFGNQGITVVDFGARDFSSNAVAASITQQPDGKLVMVGSQMDDCDKWYCMFSMAIARVDPYGSGSNGVASMIASYVSAPTAGGDVELPLRRTGGSTGTLTVDYRTVARTATAGEDFVASSGTVSWADGDLGDKTISITVLDDQQAPGSEYFEVILSNASGGLAMDRTTIGIYRNARSGPTPPPGGWGSSTNGLRGGGNSGGGALGIELCLLALLLLALLHKKRGRLASAPSL